MNNTEGLDLDKVFKDNKSQKTHISDIKAQVENEILVIEKGEDLNR